MKNGLLGGRGSPRWDQSWGHVSKLRQPESAKRRGPAHWQGHPTFEQTSRLSNGVDGSRAPRRGAGVDPPAAHRACCASGASCARPVATVPPLACRVSPAPTSTTGWARPARHRALPCFGCPTDAIFPPRLGATQCHAPRPVDWPAVFRPTAGGQAGRPVFGADRQRQAGPPSVEGFTPCIGLRPPVLSKATGARDTAAGGTWCQRRSFPPVLARPRPVVFDLMFAPAPLQTVVPCRISRELHAPMLAYAYL
jgi:hypothetical protein